MTHSAKTYYPKLINQRLNQLGFFFGLLLALLAPISTAGSNIAMYLMFLLFILSGDWTQKISLLKNPIVAIGLLLFIWVLIGTTLEAR